MSDHGFFRHLAGINGGVVSVYLIPTQVFGFYDFWIYICPREQFFSKRIAAQALREIASNGTKPWGCIHLNSDPIKDQLRKYLTTDISDLPTQIKSILT